MLMTTNFWRIIYSAPKYVPGKGNEILTKKSYFGRQIFRENAILPNVGIYLFTKCTTSKCYISWNCKNCKISSNQFDEKKNSTNHDECSQN